MFDERKSAQAAAYLISKSGDTEYHLKLIKLLYLADRLSFKKYNYPITGDTYFAMAKGPVLSNVLNHISGEKRGGTSWTEYISDKENHRVSLAGGRNLSVEDLDELSESDIEVLDEVYETFGAVDRWKLVDYCHNPAHIPEWHDITEGSKKIEVGDLLAHMGKSRATINSVLEEEKYEGEFRKALLGAG